MWLLILVSGLAIGSFLLGLRALCGANLRRLGEDRPGTLRKRFEWLRGGVMPDASDTILAVLLFGVAFALGTCATILEMMRTR